MRKIITLLVLLNLAEVYSASAQDTTFATSGYDTLSLQDLMNIKLTVASATELTPRQSPAIVTYITSADIKNSGATDLMSVLKQIPGFDFGADVEGVVGLGVRGNWAHEGKVVLFIDGQEMNEGLYSTLQFGNHYPIESVERIEIIRGPGSAMYGGYAAHAVINVITRTPSSKFEIQANSNFGVSQSITNNAGGNIYIGAKSKNRMISLNVNRSFDQRSMQNYTDVFGNSYSMKNNSELENTYINFKSSFGNLYFIAIKNDHRINQRDEYVEIASENIPIEFNDLFTELRYQFKFKEKWKFIPSINYKTQTPWHYNPKDRNVMDEVFNISSKRISSSLNAIYNYSTKLNISSGVTYFKDIARNNTADEVFNTTSNQVLSYDNLAIFSQGLYQLNRLKFVFGARFNKNSRYESTLVPRVGITADYEKYHFKLLYSKSFRAPSTQNIDLSENIRPEVTTVYEAESGLSISEYSYITLNLYHIATNNPIIYYYNELTDFDAYRNDVQTGSYGFELDYKFKKKSTGINLGLSYYNTTEENENSIYYCSENSNAHIGFAPIKFTLQLNHNFSKSLSLAINGNLLSSRYGVDYINIDNQESIYKKYPIQKEINAFIDYNFTKLEGCSIGVGCTNIIDERIYYIQPYKSDHAAIPGAGRVFRIKLSFQNF
jgi:outer membrane cobalamin receptor